MEGSAAGPRIHDRLLGGPRAPSGGRSAAREARGQRVRGRSQALLGEVVSSLGRGQPPADSTDRLHVWEAVCLLLVRT